MSLIDHDNKTRPGKAVSFYASLGADENSKRQNKTKRHRTMSSVNLLAIWDVGNNLDLRSLFQVFRGRHPDNLTAGDLGGGSR